MSQVSLSQQLKEGNLFAEQCPSREVLKHVTSRWGVLILVALREGTPVSYTHLTLPTTPYV